MTRVGGLELGFRHAPPDIYIIQLQVLKLPLVNVKSEIKYQIYSIEAS